MAKPNKENIITAILEELGNNTSYTDCLRVILGKFSLSSPTFDKYWKIANERHAITQIEAQQAIKEVAIATAVEGAKQGLKSRLEYCLEIQRMLDANETDDMFFDVVTKKEHKYKRPLTPLERKALYERISKFEGMDAPTKTDQKIELKLGKDLADESYT